MKQPLFVSTWIVGKSYLLRVPVFYLHPKIAVNLKSLLESLTISIQNNKILADLKGGNSNHLS